MRITLISRELIEKKNKLPPIWCINHRSEKHHPLIEEFEFAFDVLFIQPMDKVEYGQYTGISIRDFPYSGNQLRLFKNNVIRIDNFFDIIGKDFRKHLRF